jgi:hypothetical protein
VPDAALFTGKRDHRQIAPAHDRRPGDTRALPPRKRLTMTNTLPADPRTNADPRVDLSPVEAKIARTRAEAAIAGRLTRFTANAPAGMPGAVPRALLWGMTVSEFKMLTPLERAAALFERVEIQEAERLIDRRAPRVKAITVTPPAPAPLPVPEAVAHAAPSRQALAVRWFVSCARGCGTMIPTNGPRPVIRKCAGGSCLPKAAKK